MNHRRNLPLLILLVVAVVALLIVLPFPPRIINSFTRRAQSVTSAIATRLPGSVPSSTSQEGSEGTLISSGVPAFSSNSYTPASNANDGSYDTFWRSQGAPAWLAYDLSRVPATRRDKVLVAWYNESTNYDHTIINNPTYNTPQDYTIDASSAPGGGNPPTTGWVTLVTVHGNHLHSRQHVVSMAGYNWLRINVTANDGAAENYDAEINMDVYDASTALSDDWIFFGDSITAGSMGHTTLNGVTAFAQQVTRKSPV